MLMEITWSRDVSWSRKLTFPTRNPLETGGDLRLRARKGRVVFLRREQPAPVIPRVGSLPIRIADASSLSAA
jgi:hypothetical protein